MSEQTKIAQNVDRLTLPDKEVFLVGTAHISPASVELVRRVIAEQTPDCVAVELCRSRYTSMKDPERWKNTDLVQVIRDGKAYVLLTQVALAGFQRKLAKQLDIQPGAEMIAALHSAEQVGAAPVLADREVRVTMRRAWAALSWWQAFKVPMTLLTALASADTVDATEIEKLKEETQLANALEEFSKAFPALRRALIDERDTYLAEKIRTAPGKKIVAVVGAGHVPGIIRAIRTPTDIAHLDVAPPATLASKLLGWLIPVAFIAILVWGFFSAGAKTSFDMAAAWVVITGAGAALGSLVCLAHPLTILAAFVAAPITTLHPLLASGWIAGIVEAMVRKPRVADLETLPDDITSAGGLFRNRFTKTLLIVAFTNLLGTIAALFAAKYLLSML